MVKVMCRLKCGRGEAPEGGPCLDCNGMGFHLVFDVVPATPERDSGAEQGPSVNLWSVIGGAL